MHGQIVNLDAGADAATAPSPRADAARARVVLLQTQAEAAGAQEIARMLGCGFTARGYDVHYGFFFRRTAAYDAQPRTFFCSRERPTSPWQLVRMFAALVRHLRELRPDAVLCFQHYGNVVGTLAARCAGVRTVIANRNSVQSLVPRWLDAIDLLFGVIGWFAAIVLNSGAVEQEYNNHPRRYRKRLLRIDNGFERKTTVLSREHARRVFGLPADAVLLGDVARFHPIKNLTAAIRLLPGRDWHLALVGQGAQREQLIDFAAPSACSTGCTWSESCRQAASAISWARSTRSSFPRSTKRSGWRWSRPRRPAFPWSPMISKCCGRCWRSTARPARCSST